MTNRTVGFIAVAIVLCGALGLWATGSSSLSSETADRIVGTVAIVAMVLAACALRPRSWTRLSLAAACAFAGALVFTAFIEPHDDSMDASVVAYLLYNILLVMAATVTLVISIIKHDERREY